MKAPAPQPYAEFGVQSNFSFLRGASKPEELVVSACLLGHAAMGLADRNTVAGAVRAWSQSRSITLAKDAEPIQLPYHPGCRLVFSDGTPDILAYPQDRGGWGHLCRMLTAANFRGEKGEPDLRFGDLMDWGDRLSLAVLPRLEGQPEAELDLLKRLKSRFGGYLRLAVSPLYRGDDRFRLAQADAMAGAADLALMAVNDVLYHAPERRPLQDVMTAIRLKRPVASVGFELQANAERHLKSASEMARLFRRHPHAIAETIRFAAELTFDFSELKHNYPDEPTRDGATPQEELERLAWEGARERYPAGIPEKLQDLIRHELRIVEQLKYARYFLTVHDIVRFARGQGILCQGRGSAANSVICYCLYITDVGPDIIDHLFERFISVERGEPPDIDVDFEHEKRDVVIAYIYEKYSDKRTALAASVTTYRGRSALREVGKALGLSDDAQTAMASSVWHWSGELGEAEAKAAGLQQTDPLTRRVMDLSNQIQGFPRHLSQHVGGFVITRDRLDEIVPIVKTAMEERKMVEWDKDDLDAVGILKVDILALGMLSCLRRAFDLLDGHYGQWLTIADLFARSEEQPCVYDMIQRADTLGVFQIESRAQMTMLPRLKPKEFYDLVIEVAIVRPGPIQGDMVHPYLRRRENKEEVVYPSAELREVLHKTLGVPLFQEQAMKIAIVAGGFTPAKADKLRRAMATFKRVGTIGQLRQDMIDGMVEKNYPRDFAERCFKQIEGFGEYGFPESHAASFALLVYVSCWFKTYYPDVFCAAILNAQPMGFYAPAQLVRDAQDHGVIVLPADINFSDWDCTLEEDGFDPARIAARHASMRGVIRSRHAVRLGFRQIKGLSKDDLDRLVARRGAGYASVRDVWLRSGLHIAAIEKLAGADAFRSIGLDRREALWAVKALDGRVAADRLPLLDDPASGLVDHEPAMQLPLMPLGEHVIHDYRSHSLSLKAHPVSFLRERLDAEGVTRSAVLPELKTGRRISVAGLVLVRQRPGSAKGVIFMTIEDEGGVANIIVWTKVFERFRSVVLGARLVRVTGRLQSQSGVIHLVAERVEDLTPWLADLSEAALTIDPTGPTDEVRRPVNESRGAGVTKAKIERMVAQARAEREGNAKLAHALGDDSAPGERQVPGECHALGDDRQADIARASARVMPKGRNFQ